MNPRIVVLSLWLPLSLLAACKDDGPAPTEADADADTDTDTDADADADADTDTDTDTDTDVDTDPPIENGLTCATAASVTGTPATAALAGVFDSNVNNVFSCDSNATNTSWFKFLAPTTGDYEVTAINNSQSDPFSNLVIFDGVSCSMADAEVLCQFAEDSFIEATVPMIGGEEYLLAFHTDGEGFTMVDPEVSIEPIVCGDGVVAGNEECDGTAFDVTCVGGSSPTVCTPGCTADLSSCPPPPEGFVCDNPVDLTGATFPLEQTGTFDDDPPAFFSCAGPVTNIVWYSYVAPATGEFEIDAFNASNTGPFSRLVVLEGDSCSPFGAELACETSSNASIASSVSLVENETYLIGFYTDGDPYTMVDPQITIAEVVCGNDIAQGTESCDGTDTGGAVCFDQTTPAGCANDCTLDFSACPAAPDGAYCDQPLEVTDAPLPVEAAGPFTTAFEDFASCSDPSLTMNAIHYAFTPLETGNYIFSASATTSFTPLTFAVFEGSTCAPTGPEVACGIDFNATVQTSATLVGGEPYLLIFGTEDFSPLLDPSLTYENSVCGDGIVELDEACDGADLQGQLCSDGITEPTCNPDCTLNESACPELEGETCASAIPITGSISETVTLGSYVNDYNLQCGGPDTSTGPDHVHVLELQDGQTVTLSATSISAFFDDLVVAIADDCSAVLNTCLAKGDDILFPSPDPEIASYTNNTGGPTTVYLFTSDYESFDTTGDVMVDITVTP